MRDTSGRPLRVGLVGCGAIARSKHIPGLRRLSKKVRLVAVSDQAARLATDTARLFHVPSAYRSLSEMLGEESLDFVDLCVPPQAHAKLAVEALEQGCHILMEKPMALLTEECDWIIRAAEKVNKKVCVVHNDLFHPPMISAKGLVDIKAIGDVVGMRVLLSTPREDMLEQASHWYHKLPGGVLGETGPHVAYLSAAFIKNIASVSVVAGSTRKLAWAPFDDFHIDLAGENGICSATVQFGRECRAAVVELLGTNGTLSVDIIKMVLLKDSLKSMRYSAIGRSSLRALGEMMAGLLSNAVSVAMRRARVGTDIIIAKFADSILDGTGPPVTAQEGREAVRIMRLVVDELERKYPDSFTSAKEAEKDGSQTS